MKENNQSKAKTPKLTERERIKFFKQIYSSCTWAFMHSVAASYPHEPTPIQKYRAKQMMESIAELYPCEVCRDDFKENIQKSPPKTSNREELSIWVCDQHNEVNKKLGKPTMDCSKIWRLWGYDDTDDDDEGEGEITELKENSENVVPSKEEKTTVVDKSEQNGAIKNKPNTTPPKKIPNSKSPYDCGWCEDELGAENHQRLVNLITSMSGGSSEEQSKQ